MALLTRGPISFTPITLRTELSLSAVLELMSGALASDDDTTTGWGSTNDDAEYLGRPGPSGLRASEPQLLNQDEIAPDRIVARYYWRRTDRGLLEVVSGQDPLGVQRLKAADIIISATSNDDEYVALLGSRRRIDINGLLVPALESLSDEESAHGRVQVLSSISPLDFGDDDFFRWLAYRWVNSPQVTGDLNVRDIRAVEGQDLSNRGTSISRGVGMDRPEFLALLMAASVRLGPAKFLITSEKLGLNLDLELRVDGGFSIQVGESDYDDESLGRLEIGPLLVRDAAYHVIPELRYAYNEDDAWRDTQREESIADAREKMRAVLGEDTLRCANCLAKIAER